MSVTFQGLPFVLISENAVADHQKAIEYDGCLKRFGEVHNPCDSEEYFALCRGAGLELDGQVNEHTSFLATILFAARHLDNIETMMQQIRPDDWYSPHLICRFKRIEEITTMVPPLREKLRQLYANGSLVNPGWEPCWIFAGHTGHKRLKLESPTIEANLSSDHPFMLAKRTNGRVTERSKRIMLMCDIGKRGLNNWPLLGTCNFVNDCSETEDIQFDFGRPCRWPPHLAAWHRDPSLEKFLTTVHFIPPVLYDMRKAALNKALQKIVSLREIVKQKNLPTWESMLDGDVPEATDIKLNPPSPLTSDEKMLLATRLGQAIRQAEGKSLTEENIQVISDVFETPVNGSDEQPVKVKLAQTFVATLLQPEGKRIVRRLLGYDIDEQMRQDPIIVVRQLKPKPLNQYSIDELKTFVKSEAGYRDDLNERLKRLDDGDKLVIKDMARELQRIQRMTYHEPGKYWSLWGKENGVIVEVANEMANELIRSGTLDPEQRFGTTQAVAAACKILFGIGDASENREMDHHAYHVAIREKHRSDIKALARSLLVRDGVLPNLEALALYHGEQAHA